MSSKKHPFLLLVFVLTFFLRAVLTRVQKELRHLLSVAVSSLVPCERFLGLGQTEFVDFCFFYAFQEKLETPWQSRVNDDRRLMN